MFLEALQPYMLSYNYSFNETYVITQKDSLFWCFYILCYGYELYETPGTVNFVFERDEKFKCIDKIKEQKQLLKHYKLHHNIIDILDDLANQTCISIKTFIALCVCYRIPIFFVQKNKYYEVGKLRQQVVHFNERYASIGGYFDVEKMKKLYFKWENIEKPLKSCSAFKLQELKDLCQRMHITFEDNLKKQVLYNLLKEKII